MAAGGGNAFVEALERAFDAWYDDLWRYARSRLGADLADDVVEEVFLVALKRADAFDSAVGDARPWLFGIARNVVHGHRRAERRRLKALAAMGGQAWPPSADHSDEVAAAHDARQLSATMAGALVRLPRAQYEVLSLSVWGQLSDQEISEALAIPPGTVRSRLSRAKSKLREHILSSGQELDE